MQINQTIDHDHEQNVSGLNETQKNIITRLYGLTGYPDSRGIQNQKSLFRVLTEKLGFLPKFIRKFIKLFRLYQML